MTDPEKLIGATPLPEPPESLNRRVAAAMDEARHRHGGRRPAMVPLWAFAAGCMACTLIGFLIHPLVEWPAPPPTASDGVGVVIVEPLRRDLRVLGTKPDRKQRSFWLEERGELKPLVRGN